MQKRADSDRIAPSEALPPDSPPPVRHAAAESRSAADIARMILKPLASLKLTVVLFSLAIVIVLFGTLAQWRKSEWIVIEEYFRRTDKAHPFVFVELRDLTPASFFGDSQPPEGWGFYFPCGWLIGALMGVNLLAAHLIRFKVQARGVRLGVGLGVLAVGILAAVLVVLENTGDTLQGDPSFISWTGLWCVFLGGLAVIGAGMIGASFLLASERVWERRLLLGAGSIASVVALVLAILGEDARLNDSAMRIMWQLMQGGLAGVIMLVGCILLFRKRGGVVLLHGGIAVLMLSEFIVGKWQVEGQMQIREGEMVSYTVDLHKSEIAFIDTQHPEHDFVAAAPASRLKEGRVFHDEQLPASIEVVKWYANAVFAQVSHESLHGQPVRVTKGWGRDFYIEEKKASAGAQVGGGVDFPAAYVRLWSKPSPGGSETQDPKLLGVYLLSANAVVPQKMAIATPRKATYEDPAAQEHLHQVGDKTTFELALRLKRTYKPYRVYVERTDATMYPGTSKPMDYSSYIRMIDPENQVDMPTRIWMNNPLRYGGETFYQSQYSEPNGFGVTGLQVVTNQGWILPYIACMIVATGMLAHFYIVLMRFLKRRGGGETLMKWGALVVPGGGWLQFLGMGDRKAAAELSAKSERKARRKAERAAELEQMPAWRRTIELALPATILALAVWFIVGHVFPPRAGEGEAKIYEFGELPVMHKGRIKPLDSLARVSLNKLSNRQTFKDRVRRVRFEVVVKETGVLDQMPLFFRSIGGEVTSEQRSKTFEGTLYTAHVMLHDALDDYDSYDQERRKKIKKEEETLVELMSRAPSVVSAKVELESKDTIKRPAIEWLLDVIARPEAARRYRVFKFTNPDILKLLGLERRKGHMYALEEFVDQLGDLGKQAALARQVKDSGKLNTYQKKVVEAERKVGVVFVLQQAFATDLRVLQQMGAGKPGWEEQLMRHEPPLMVPAKTSDDPWRPLSLAYLESVREAVEGGMSPAEALAAEPSPPLGHLLGMIRAHRTGDASAFNASLEKYEKWLYEVKAGAEGESATPEHVAVDRDKLEFERFYNHMAPSFYSSWLYLVAFVLAALAWLGWSGPLNRSAFWLICFTLVVHTFALVARMYISGRPPVTNLYSSAVFIGWGCVIAGIIIESVFRIGIGNVLASITGFASLMIGYLLHTYVSGHQDDTMEVLQAVLDTQFWLATHVTCITLGYSTTFLAGLLGIIYILRGVCTPSLTPAVGKELNRMIYGTVCFSIFFSLVGTVLGGLWADDSWGRFWGWDPKENGALIIVIWNALVLHARWGGMIKERGLATLAVVGNIVTAWSWFGVNELGVGLHSYGFTEGVLLILGIFFASQLLIIGLGMLPRSLWWSYAAREQTVMAQAVHDPHATARRRKQDRGE